MTHHTCQTYLKQADATNGRVVTCICGMMYRMIRRWPWTKWKNLGKRPPRGTAQCQTCMGHGVVEKPAEQCMAVCPNCDGKGGV